jgi:hypothetical protein
VFFPNFSFLPVLTAAKVAVIYAAQNETAVSPNVLKSLVLDPDEILEGCPSG